MAISTERMGSILARVVNGQDPFQDETEEERDFRLGIEPEVEEIKARGGIVDIPQEWPDLSDDL